MNRRKLILLAVALFCCLLAAGGVLAQGNVTTIDWWVVSSGGGPASGGGAVALNGTLGQPIVASVGNTPVFLGMGYWYGADAEYVVYLPLALRNG
jgi:hypothetical protein